MTARRFVVLTLAGVLFLGGLGTGVKLLTASADTAKTTATCADRTINTGEKLTSNLVTVNVFNASRRAGLANRVDINLQRNGFLAGQIGNSISAAKPSRVAILTDDRNDPQVKLVAAQFRDKVHYAKPDVKVDSGVIIIVGDDYTGLNKKAEAGLTASKPVTVCVPTVRLP
jgi:LytR cell envelope-related transcriptional attenuator